MQHVCAAFLQHVAVYSVVADGQKAYLGAHFAVYRLNLGVRRIFDGVYFFAPQQFDDVFVKLFRAGAYDDAFGLGEITAVVQKIFGDGVAQHLASFCGRLDKKSVLLFRQHFARRLYPKRILKIAHFLRLWQREQIEFFVFS